MCKTEGRVGHELLMTFPAFARLVVLLAHHYFVAMAADKRMFFTGDVGTWTLPWLR